MSLDACLDRFRRSGCPGSFAVVESIDSTNRLARSVAEFYLVESRPIPPFTLLAVTQTAGRGRLGRSWDSPAGGIYTSILTSVGDVEELGGLPLRVPTALCVALRPHLRSPCRIKWPNDLVVEGKKLGGVLIEAVAGPRAVVIGYGVNHTRVPGKPLAPEATWIERVGSSPPALEALALELARAVLDELSQPPALVRIVDRYRRHSAHEPGDTLRCEIGAEIVSGRFEGFDPRGRLRLRTAAGERVLSAGEIVHGAPTGGQAER